MLRRNRTEGPGIVGRLEKLVTLARPAGRGIAITDRMAVTNKLDLTGASGQGLRGIAGRQEEAVEMVDDRLALRSHLDARRVRAGRKAADTVQSGRRLDQRRQWLAVDHDVQDGVALAHFKIQIRAPERRLEIDARPLKSVGDEATG